MSAVEVDPRTQSSTQLDQAFRDHKNAIRTNAIAQATAVWQKEQGDRNRFLGQVLTLVEAAQSAVVQLTSGYLALKSRQALGEGQHKPLDTAKYTVAELRGKPGVQVYSRPFGALYGQLNQGASPEDAQASAIADLSRLVATDIQMAYTASARDWMAGDDRVGGYRRVLSGTCDYCESAASGLYHGDVQMPIHENCECDVEPYFGSAAGATAAFGLGFHSGDAGSTPDSQTGDLETRLDTTGAVPAPLKARHRHGRKAEQGHAEGQAAQGQQVTTT